MLERIAHVATKFPRQILVVTFLLLVGGGILGGGVADHLKSGGFNSPTSESSRAADQLISDFNVGNTNLVVALTAKDGADSAAARIEGDRVTNYLKQLPYAIHITSYWQLPPAQAAPLRSKDGKAALVTATLEGDDTEAPLHAGTVVDALNGQRGDVSIKVGGLASAYHQVTERTSKDLAIAEAVTIPITVLVLFWVFGSAFASLLPLAVGLFAILETLAVLRIYSFFTDVSIYAMNMTTAMGFALAIDYSLFIVSRYREELRRGLPTNEAITRSVQTAGRTVLFSSLTVALSLGALIVFPLYFLRSFAYAGLAVVLLAALASIVVLPACLALIGPRIDKWDVRVPIRRLLRRPTKAPALSEADAVTASAWYRIATFTTRRPLLIAVPLIVGFLILGSPFLRGQWGYPDDRILATSSGSSARQVGDLLRRDFDTDAATASVALLPSTGADNSELTSYSRTLSDINGVNGVTSSQGTFSHGNIAGPGNPAMSNTKSSYVTIASSIDPYSDAGIGLLAKIRSVPAPTGQALVTGPAAQNSDSVGILGDRLPLALAIIALTSFVILFLFTGSVILPLKALALNMLSLTATFGAMVWIFAEGHLGSLFDFTATGHIVPTMPVLMFCLAFGMSMDYEVFLLSRIREEWLNSPQTSEANTHAVAVGLARTGRIVTAAALLMAIVFAGMTSSKVAFMQLFGLGMTLAILADATLVRGFLVPAFMQLMGRANWWAPGPLRRLHDKFGLSESNESASSESRDPELATAASGGRN